jgi:hypothetical protein
MQGVAVSQKNSKNGIRRVGVQNEYLRDLRSKTKITLLHNFAVDNRINCFFGAARQMN